MKGLKKGRSTVVKEISSLDLVQIVIMAGERVPVLA